MTSNVSLINQTIGNYRVTSLLGEGGMGVVYLAQHPVIGRKVAIKLLHAVLARDQDIVSRFFNEARAIHMIAHENIVEILDFGQTTDGQPYFIMEYLVGEALSDAVSRGPMTPEEVEAIGVQMCKALWAAHAKGIVHRDLKPHNVQLVPRAEGSPLPFPLVKILDFGVAKILASPDGAQSVKTRTGSLMGTPLYMSPEQCKGAGTLDHRTDIYSLGVMLFEMLAGRPPFVAEGVGELFAKHMLEEAPQLTEFAPHVAPHMAAAIMKALAKEPRDRFQSMDEFRKALIGEVKLANVPGSLGGRPNGADAGHHDPVAEGLDDLVVGLLGDRRRCCSRPAVATGRSSAPSAPWRRSPSSPSWRCPRATTNRRSRRQPSPRPTAARRAAAARGARLRRRRSCSASRPSLRARTSSPRRTARTWARSPWSSSSRRGPSPRTTCSGWPAIARSR